MAFKMSQEFLTVSLDVTTFRRDRRPPSGWQEKIHEIRHNSSRINKKLIKNVDCGFS